MLLTIYLLIALILSASILYRYSGKRYKVYLLVMLVLMVGGLIVENDGISKNNWVWNVESPLFFSIPIYMILIYGCFGVAISVLAVHFNSTLKFKASDSVKRCALPALMLGALTLITAPLYGLNNSLLMMFLFATAYLFLKYQSPIIVLSGVSLALIDILFDSLLVLSGELHYSIMIPYKTFFIAGMFISGLSIFLDEKLYHKK